MGENLNIDHQRGQVSAPLDGNKAIIINNNDARSVELPEYGEVIIKVSGGKVHMFEVKEQHKC